MGVWYLGPESVKWEKKLKCRVGTLLHQKESIISVVSCLISFWIRLYTIIKADHGLIALKIDGYLHRENKQLFNLIKQTIGCPGEVARLVGMSSYTQEWGFDSLSGHMPRFWVQSPDKVRTEGNWSMFLTYIHVSLSLPHFFSL